MPLTNTENLALAAYALAGGATLRRISVSSVSRANGRRTAVFELDSPDMEKLSRLFYEGRAVVNLERYRNHVERLKDALFAALHQTQTETQDQDRRSHDPHRQGRARAPQGTR